MYTLFTLENTSFGSLLLELLILVVISLVIIWVTTVISANVLDTGSIGYKQRIKLSGLNALLVLMAFFTLYISVFTYFVGNTAFEWASFPMNVANTYFQLLPQLLIFIGLIISYIIVSANLKKETKLN